DSRGIAISLRRSVNHRAFHFSEVIIMSPLFSHSQPAHEPFSRQTVQKTSRLRGATVTESICPYCAVGCGQLVYTKGGKIIDIEGHPNSPINEGTLCPKGADAFQLAVNPHRVT